MFRFLAMLILTSMSAHAVDVSDVRIWNGPDSSRLVLDLSGRPDHHFSRLANPDRLVVDIRDARLRTSKISALTPNDAIQSVRVGRRGKADLRIVVDLARRVKARSYVSAPNHRYGYRLVIEMDTTESVPPKARIVATGAPAAREAQRPVAVRGPAPAQLPMSAEPVPVLARDIIIAIDAGHGGEDPGATGKNGTHEKDVVLAIAKELAQQVNAEPGMRAVLIRDGDYFVPLRDRMQRARRQQADLFVSVHADSIRNRDVTGSSVYVLSQRGATDEAARWLAERENAADLVGGVSLENKGDVLASVLLDLSQTAALNASQAAASSVLRRLDQIGEVRKRRVQQARFLVLKSPDVPSMLVETAYISNPAEEKRLRSRSYQGRLAVAIHQGIKDFFYSNPPTGTRVAQLAAQKAGVPIAGMPPKRNGAGT